MNIETEEEFPNALKQDFIGAGGTQSRGHTTQALTVWKDDVEIARLRVKLDEEQNSRKSLRNTSFPQYVSQTTGRCLDTLGLRCFVLLCHETRSGFFANPLLGPV